MYMKVTNFPKTVTLPVTRGHVSLVNAWTNVCRNERNGRCVSHNYDFDGDHGLAGRTGKTIAQGRPLLRRCRKCSTDIRGIPVLSEII